ncbi:flagellin [Planococcus sp. SSTMD024]|uniref:flagellin N-terminal helical domain-containing protein n=1 Tax=Planococcus sp. SSTMD024 TaxID=3242163 RepID=UPI00351E8BC5
MIINHNIAALNTHRQMGTAQSAQMDSMEKLSSGLRINKAADDAAGLSISEKMRGQIRGLEQGSRNAQDGISMIQTAEGALGETQDILQRMRELAVQSASDTNTADDRAQIQKENAALLGEIDRIAETTQFNGKNLLDGTLGVKIDDVDSTISVGSDSVTGLDIAGAKASTTYTLTSAADGEITIADDEGNEQTIKNLSASHTGTLNFDNLGIKISVKDLDTTALGNPLNTGEIVTTAATGADLQIGANEGQRLGITIGNMDTSALGLAGLDVSDHTKAGEAITAINNAIVLVSGERSSMGANQNRLEHTINNLNTSSENLTAAESRIRDVDYAEAA